MARDVPLDGRMALPEELRQVLHPTGALRSETSAWDASGDVRPDAAADALHPARPVVGAGKLVDRAPDVRAPDAAYSRRAAPPAAAPCKPDAVRFVGRSLDAPVLLAALDVPVAAGQLARAEPALQAAQSEERVRAILAQMQLAFRLRDERVRE
jgi:hypothetical protein